MSVVVEDDGSRLGRRSCCRPSSGTMVCTAGRAWLQNESMERPLSESKGRDVRSWASDVVRWLNGGAFQDRVWAGDLLVGCRRGRRCGARMRVWCETHSSRVSVWSLGSEARARIEATDGRGGGADGEKWHWGWSGRTCGCCSKLTSGWRLKVRPGGRGALWVASASVPIAIILHWITHLGN